MVKLAIELIKQQTSPSQPADIEGRYERRMREMIQAKLKGDGITEEVTEPEQSNVIDPMAGLKRSLGSSTEAPAPRHGLARNPRPAANPPRPPNRRLHLGEVRWWHPRSPQPQPQARHQRRSGHANAPELRFRADRVGRSPHRAACSAGTAAAPFRSGALRRRDELRTVVRCVLEPRIADSKQPCG
jgi:hypothetical protein